MTGLSSSSVATIPNDTYYSQTDEAEAARLREMAGAVGYGDTLYDDPEHKAMMEDLSGFGLDGDESYINGQR